MAQNTLVRSGKTPLILTVPGLDNSGPGHWQTRWEQSLPDCRRAELGLWDSPHRNTWVNQLNMAILRAGRPVVLAAHSLGCHAVAWWAEYEGPEPGTVIGALLVAPPDVEDRPLDRRLTRFAPLAPSELPFPSILVASGNDPYADLAQSRHMARIWGSKFVDAGAAGHLNAQSELGDWALGRLLLNRLLPRPLVARSGGGFGYGAVQRPFMDPALRRLGA